MIKKISAIAAAAAIAATMSVSAFAATKDEAVKAAQDAGVPGYYVTQLDNYLTKNEKNFSSAQYDDMVKSVKSTADKYVAPIANRKFNGKTPAQLSEAERKEVAKDPEFDAKACADALIDLGNRVGVKVTAEKNDDGKTWTITATDPAASNNVENTKNTTTGTGTSTKTDAAVAGTGAETESNNAAAAAAAIALALSAVGISVVAKKNA